MCGVELKNEIGFSGVKRRFEVRENIIHDYAHHPTEIFATIKTAKEHFKKDVIAIFEPHTYTRTAALDFTKCFKGAKKVILTPIYAAREEPIEGITSENLAKKIKGGVYASDYSEAKKLTEGFGGIILILGAGDIVKLFENWKFML